MMPAVFVGHGSPMNAIEPSRWGEAWRALGDEIGRPSAILCISAHWYRAGAAVTAMVAPRTIHDFYGFPEMLFAARYPAPGSPELAARVQEVMAPTDVGADLDWGLDHGAWSVLAHMYPDADVPVVQLAIDATQRPAYHLETGMRLAELRADDVLVLGSGNVVHNLGALNFGAGERPFDWASSFDTYVRSCLAERDDDGLLDYLAHPAARLAAPTPEHFLPLLYVVGAAQEKEEARTVTEGYVAGSLSMLSVRFG